MTTLTGRTILLTLLAGTLALGIPFDESKLDDNARKYSSAPRGYYWPFDWTNECGHNVMAVLDACAGGAILPHRTGLKAWLRGCHYKDGTNKIEDLVNHAEDYGLTVAFWSSPLPTSMQEIRDRLGGRNLLLTPFVAHEVRRV